MKSRRSLKTQKICWATSIRMLDSCRWGMGFHLPIMATTITSRLAWAWCGTSSGNGKTVVRAAGGIVYESAVTYDVTNAVSNFLGLRTIPTGVPLYNNGSATPISPAPGNIDLSTTTYTASTVSVRSPLIGKTSTQPSQSAAPTFLFTPAPLLPSAAVMDSQCRQFFRAK